MVTVRPNVAAIKFSFQIIFLIGLVRREFTQVGNQWPNF